MVDGPALDPDVVKTYEQLRDKWVQSLQAQKLNDEHLMQLERSITMKKLVLKELSTYPPDTVTYKSVGKAFIQRSRENLVGDFEVVCKNTMELATKRKADKEALTKQVEGAQSELGEYLSSNPALAHAIHNATS